MTCDSASASNAIHVVRGESKTLEVTVKDTTGSLVDVTGTKVWFTVKRRIEDVATIITKKNAAAGGAAAQALVTLPQTGTSKGKFQVYLLPADTAALSPAVAYVCDVWIEMASGKRYQVARTRSFVVDPAVTVVF